MSEFIDKIAAAISIISLVLALTAIALVVSAKSDLRKALKLNKKRGMTPYE